MNWKSAALWALATVVTLSAGVWQERTGPSYAIHGVVTLTGLPITFKLLRTHPGEGGLPVRVAVGSGNMSGTVAWRRFPTQEPWQAMNMVRSGGVLEATIPHQPPAGKVEYLVRLRAGGNEILFPPRPAIARFRGEVSPYILVPHILAMFLGMLFSTRAGLDALLGRTPSRLVWITCALIVVGGFILGPAVQKMAFDAWWTGIPYGHDLTDNKTLIAGMAWIVALVRMGSGKPARWAILSASILTLVVFAIPHSVWGSKIQWDQMTPEG